VTSARCQEWLFLGKQTIVATLLNGLSFVYVVIYKLFCIIAPRFKVHVQVIDNTGSTTFTLFDRVVSQFLGRNVQYLIEGMQHVSNFMLIF